MPDTVDQFRKLFGNRRGVIAICGGEFFDSETKKFRGKIIKVYVENTQAFYGLPVEFDQVPVEYFVCPDGLNPGCD